MPSVRRTNPDKLMWPGEALTKAGLIDYLETVRRHLLEELRDRPLTVVRGPDGIEGFVFYQKQAPAYTPAWIETATLPAPASPRRTVRYVLCNDLDTLAWLGNQASLEFHPGLARAQRPTRPDILAFDLDPPAGRFGRAVAAAKVLRHVLEGLGLRPVVKTTGGKGLHVFVPIEAETTFDGVHRAAHAVARLAIDDAPSLMTLQMRKRDRHGRVLVDIGRNSRGATVVAAFSPRARPGAPVSFPVAWDDLDRIDPGDFSIRTVPGLLETPGVVQWRKARKRPQALPAAELESQARA